MSVILHRAWRIAINITYRGKLSTSTDYERLEPVTCLYFVISGNTHAVVSHSESVPSHDHGKPFS